VLTASTDQPERQRKSDDTRDGHNAGSEAEEVHHPDQAPVTVGQPSPVVGRDLAGEHNEQKQPYDQRRSANPLVGGHLHRPGGLLRRAYSQMPHGNLRS